MKSLQELQALRDRALSQMNARDDSSEVTRVVVGMATCGIAAGARPVMNKLSEEIQKRGLRHVTVSQTGCIGLCQFEPIVEVLEPGKEKTTYVLMTEEKIAKVVNEHLVNGNPIKEFTVGAVSK